MCTGLVQYRINCRAHNQCDQDGRPAHCDSLRSANAGCYHNTELILSLKAMGDRHGVVFSRYDFSDPQSGKDVCDRKIASMKTHIRHWVNEVHDVTTAGEMKITLESHGGVRGCRFTLVEINKENLNAEVSKIPGISFLNNFQLNENGVRAWKAYQVGKGKYYPYSSVITKAQRNTEIEVLVPFPSRSGCPGIVAAASLNSPGLFSCLEEDCVKMFPTNTKNFSTIWIPNVTFSRKSKTRHKT